MTISILQSAVNTAQFNSDRTDASVSVTLAGVTAGSSLVAFVTVDSSHTASVSDGAAYAQRQLSTDTTNTQRTYCFTLDNAAAGSHTITASFAPATAYWDAIEVYEVAETAGYDASASQWQATPGTGTDGVSSTAVTPAAAGSLILGWTQNTAGGSFPALGTGFSAVSTNATLQTRGEVLVQGTAAAVSATFTAPVSQGHTTHVLAFAPLPTGQFARPASDVSAGPWTPSTGASLAGTIDETPASDTDYDSATANGTFRVNLGPVSTPDPGTRTVRFRAGGSPAKKLIATLIEAAGTTIASATIDPLPASVTAQSFTVSNAIGNYGDIDLSFEVADATAPPTPAVSFGAIGTGANGSTSVVVPVPAGIAAGDYLTIEIASGATNSEIPSTPAGWSLLATGASTDGTFGIDTGPRRATVFGKVAAGGETAVTVSITNGNTARGTMTRWTKSQPAYTWSVVAQGAADSTSGTDVSMTTAAIDWAVGDCAEVVVGQRVDSATQSAQSLTAAGTTFGARTNRSTTAVTTGNDVRHVVDTFAAATAGGGAAATTWAYTASAAVSAGGVIVRLREIPPTEFARVTFAEFEVPAASGGGASAPGATLSAAATLVAGAPSAAATVSGATLTATPSLVPGAPSVSAAAPGATLSASAALIPGAPTAGASISGTLLPATITLIPGTASAGATVPGTTLTAGMALIPGTASAGVAASAPGATIAAGATLMAGTATAGATVSGAVLPLSATLIPGSASAGAAATAPGAALIATATLIPGTATAGATIPGSVLPVTVSLFPGAPGTGAAASAPGATLSAATTLIPGPVTAGATVPGALLSVIASLLPGAANDAAAPPHTDYVAAPAARDFSASRRGRTWAAPTDRTFTAAARHRRTGT